MKNISFYTSLSSSHCWQLFCLKEKSRFNFWQFSKYLIRLAWKLLTGQPHSWVVIFKFESFNPIFGLLFSHLRVSTNSTLFCFLLLLLPLLRTGTSVATKSFGISLLFGRQWKSKQILVKYYSTKSAPKGKTQNVFFFLFLSSDNNGLFKAFLQTSQNVWTPYYTFRNNFVMVTFRIIS